LDTMHSELPLTFPLQNLNDAIFCSAYRGVPAHTTSKLRFCNPFSLFSFRFPYDPSIPYISTGKPTKVSYNSFLLIQNPIRCFILSFVRILRLKMLRVQANPGPLPLSSGERVDASHNHESMTPRDEFNNLCFIHTYDFDPVQSCSRDRIDIPELSRD